MRERLYRSRDDRMLVGVAGGMADWLDLDPAVVRLVWAILVLFGGAGLLLYIVAAIVIPEEPLEVPGTTSGPDPAADGPDAAGPIGSAGTGGASGATGWAYPSSRAERKAARRAARAARGPSGGTIVFGVILILVGGWFLLRELFPFLDERFVGPAILIGIGVVLVLAAVRRPQPPAA